MAEMASVCLESENSRENMKIFNRIMSRKAAKNDDQINCRQIMNGQIVRQLSAHPIKKSQSLTPTNSCSRFVLNGNTNFSSLRIEDPKKGKNMKSFDILLID